MYSLTRSLAHSLTHSLPLIDFHLIDWPISETVIHGPSERQFETKRVQLTADPLLARPPRSPARSQNPCPATFQPSDYLLC